MHAQAAQLVQRRVLQVADDQRRAAAPPPPPLADGLGDVARRRDGQRGPEDQAEVGRLGVLARELEGLRREELAEVDDGVEQGALAESALAPCAVVMDGSVVWGYGAEI